MGSRTPITIVTVTDNFFIVHLAALAKSIELNYSGSDTIDLFVVEDRVSNKNRKRLEESIDRQKIEIHWIALDSIIPDKTRLPLDTSSFPLNVYARLFIPDFLPEVEKVIYMDVDMIALEDITRLWETELKDMAAAGVIDVSEVISSSWAGIKNYKELGLDGNANYYNSGLLIMNCAKWRTDNLTKKIINCISENRQHANFPDQYGLNVALYGQWKQLDPRWNSYATISRGRPPFIIHFIGRKPMFQSYDHNKEYSTIFYRYLSMTRWHYFRPLPEYYRLCSKFYNRSLKKLLRLVSKAPYRI